MKRRILSLLCAVATVLGMVVVPAYAAESTTTDMGNTHVTKLTENAADLTLEGDTYIDLNGHSIAGVTVTDGTLYISDSQTDDYTVADGIYGSVTGITGNVQAAEGYVAVTEGASVSYHKVDLTLKSMTLRPAEAGVYYNSAFAADEVVATNVESYGVALSVVAEPNAENLTTLCGYSTIYGFEAGEKSGTLLTGIMTESNTDYANNRNAAMAIYGRAYIKTADGYTFGACASRDLKTQVEAIDAVFASLNDNQKAAILAMYKAFEGVIANWNVPNMKHAAAQLPQGDTVIKIPVEQEDGVVSDEITVELDGVSVTVPVGALVNMDELTLKVTRLDASESDIEAGEGQTLMPFDVHVEGIEADNTQPLTVALGKVMPENLNMGNYSIYHVEETGTNAMELVANDETFTAHNQYKYTLDGELTLHMATFSEVAAVTENENAWNGEYDYSWYLNAAAPADENGTATYEIRNADQLAGFGAVVGGMNGQTADDFAGDTVKLIANINLGDKNNANEKLIFYPIGYYYNGDSSAPYSTVYSFEGTFDGNGHTIANFYQNTWEIKGDYDGNYYKDAMGLFGYVVNGAVKNLTVDNFSSDGEFTPTGVIAAYAENSTFENIAITNCNPRVYNTGNGGIIGIGGRTDDTTRQKLVLKNITVDNSNKISALWGSWDVACGGLVGMFRGNAAPGNGTIYFENCHVAAQIDVNNDVCANYQYYAYRYAGMMIGSVRHNTTDSNGKVVPVMTGIDADGCTVHYGKWNDYYYCELVANSIASYTHDYQFSRLTPVDAVDVENKTITVEGVTTAIPVTGRYNYVVAEWKTPTEAAKCYHFVDGAVWNHADAGEEIVNGETVLIENNQHIYLPFDQLFTGYSWGVSNIGLKDFDEKKIKILDREIADSVVKFDSIEGAGSEYITGETVTIGELFKAADIEDKKLSIQSDKVQVTVSPADDTSTAGGKYTAAEEDENGIIDWTQGTLTFTGEGTATITITDYYFCIPKTVTVEVERVRFDTKFVNYKDYLYRVGNADKSTVALGTMFTANGTPTNAQVTFETVAGNASGKYTSNATWTDGTIQFSGTGVVRVTIDADNTDPFVLNLEVVDAVNATTATNATSNNVVLLNDISSGFSVSGEYTFFGNGFTLKYTGDGRYLNNGLKQGIVNVSENGTLDNLRIEASIYPKAFMYYGSTMVGDYVQDKDTPREIEGDKTRYYYQLSAVAASNDATISNCYIYGGRTNIFVGTGNVTIKDSVLECGVVANVQIQSTSSHVVELENVTTIQYQVKPTTYDDVNWKDYVMLGAGVILGPDTDSNPKIVLNGYFKQYNWVTADDANAINNDVAKMLINGALAETAFNHTINGKTASNLGIICMNEAEFTLKNNTGLPYKYAEISIDSADGQAYSVQNATDEQIYSDYVNADRSTVNGNYVPALHFELGDQTLTYDGSEDTRYLYGDKYGVNALYQDGDDPITLDLTQLASVWKYEGILCNVNVSCKDATGTALTANNGVVTLSKAGNYTLVFEAEDTTFYDMNGEKVEKSVSYTYTVPLNLVVKEASIKNAVVNITKTALDGVYTTVNVNDYKLRINFLDAISITDYDKSGNGTTVSLSSNIASAVLTPSGANVFTTATTITITYTDGRVLTVNLSNISGSSPGTKTATINTSGGCYFITEGALNNKPTEAGSQNKCTITSVSFKGTSGSTVTNDTDVTVTWPLDSGSSGGGCVTPETKITLADGSQVPVEDLTGEEMLLVWNLETGRYEAAPIVFVDSDAQTEYEVISLVFSDGTDVEIIYEHGFFDVTTGEYVYLDAYNAADYIGHSFIKQGDLARNTWETVELVDVVIETKVTTAYSPVTFGQLCYYVDGMLSMPGGIAGLFNIFEVDVDTMTYNAEMMAADIETYGLFTYEDFAAMIPEEAFYAFNGAWLKVAMGKGMLTWEDIEYMANRYVPLM